MRMRLREFPGRCPAHDALYCVRSFLFRVSSALNKTISQKVRRGGLVMEQGRASMAEWHARSMAARARVCPTGIDTSGFGEVRCA